MKVPGSATNHSEKKSVSSSIENLTFSVVYSKKRHLGYILICKSISEILLHFLDKTS